MANRIQKAFTALKRQAPLLIAVLALLPGPSVAADDEPYLYVLGVAQDAGYPQAGCYRPHCLPGWNDRGLRRGAVSLGLVHPGSGSKYLFEATPDLPEQLFELEKIAPSDSYDFKGVFLTHAHIGHYTGLMHLGHEAMGAREVPVFAMPRMREYLGTSGPWSQLVNFKNIRLVPIEDPGSQDFGHVSVRPFLVPHRDEYSETVGYRIEGPNKSAVFIPDIDKWSRWDRDIADLVREVDYALIDATFYDGNELPNRDMSAVPHPFVVESMDLFRGLSREERNKIWFIHLNHTNPLLDPDSRESQSVREQGFNIATEGVRLGL